MGSASLHVPGPVSSVSELKMSGHCSGDAACSCGKRDGQLNSCRRYARASAVLRGTVNNARLSPKASEFSSEVIFFLEHVP